MLRHHHMNILSSPLGMSKPIILAATSVAALAVIGLGAFLLSSKDNSTPPKTQTSSTHTDLSEEFPSEWAQHHEDSLPFQISSTPSGPTLQYEDLTINLALTFDENYDFTWSSSSLDDDTILLKGSTPLPQGGSLSLIWSFHKNSPQITLSTALKDVPLHALAQHPLRASMTLPPSSYKAISNTMRFESLSSTTTLSSWNPGWITSKISSHDLSLSFSDWNFTAVTINPEASSQQLIFTLLDPSNLPSFEGCPPDTDQKTTIEQQLTITIGERIPLVQSRQPQGYRAAIAPLFLDPASHKAGAHKDARAKNAQDWTLRSKTLLYGHSMEDDPRFGNGGLLGLGLGADLAMEPSWQSAPSTKKLVEQLRNSRASLLARTTQNALENTPLLLDTPQCAPFLQPHTPYLTLGVLRSPSQTNILEHPPSITINDATVKQPLPPLLSNHSTHLEVPQLSGNRTELYSSIFSTPALTNLIQQRGVALFATPLIATRNPLSRSASNALLEPERKGQWTLSESFSKSLANIELINEKHNILVTSPTQLIAYWMLAKQVRILELPDGSVALLNPTNKTIKNFSLVMPGNLSPKLTSSSEDISHKEIVTTSEGSSQTWFWLDLPPGTTQLTPDSSIQSTQLKPVHWELKN